MNINFEGDKKTNRWAEGEKKRERLRILCRRTTDDITMKALVDHCWYVCLTWRERNGERKREIRAKGERERTHRGSLTWARFCCSRLQEIQPQNT